MSHPAPLKVLFFNPKITTFHSSATPCTPPKKKKIGGGGGGICLVIFLGGVSMGLYKFYLGTHKSGKKENLPTATLSHPPISIMPKLQ